jgi:hypothetical protein
MAEAERDLILMKEPAEGINRYEAETDAARLALRKKADIIFTFNGKPYEMTLDRASDRLSSDNLRRRIQDLQNQISYLEGKSESFKSQLEQEIAFALEIYGLGFFSQAES